MPTFDCQVTWPTDPTQGALIAPQLLPQHKCVLAHWHVTRRPYGSAEGGPPQPHVCHCGEQLPVRDVESASRDCPRCDGCGRVGTDDEHAPWTFWESLPPGSDLAVRLGFVKPVECTTCSGSGRVAA